MKILGISCYYHDSSAAMIDNGKIIAAVQEERFTRKKHTAELPIYSISYCLDEVGLNMEELDAVVFYENPVIKFDRNLTTEIAVLTNKEKPYNDGFRASILQKLALPSQLRKIFGKLGKQDSLFTVPHHLSHAASAFFPSPFHDAAVLVIDGIGEWASTSLGLANGSNIEIVKTIEFPNSLGLLYSAFTYYCGFKVNSGEYKLMGLAPYGKPIYKEKILSELIDLKSDGSYQLNLKYFGYLNSEYLINKEFCRLFGGDARKAESQIKQKEMDLAASIQSVLEDTVIKIAQNLRNMTGKRNLVMAGGIALNCTANGKIIRNKIFDNVWIQPASGDAGGSLGAALAYNYLYAGQKRNETSSIDSQFGSFLGPKFDNDEIVAYLSSIGAVYKYYDEDELINLISKFIAKGKVIGHFFGKMEFGPRALGGRSIIADPRNPKMQSRMNLKIKYRESFRPFAPSILEECVEEYFEEIGHSPYMLITEILKEKHLQSLDHTNDKSSLDIINRVNQIRSSIPAVTHIDNSARVQIVNKDINSRFYKIIYNFYQNTGCPLCINTSFNIRGEPIVCTPEDAYKCFMGTDMDVLVLENMILIKNEQNKITDDDYKDEYELD